LRVGKYTAKVQGKATAAESGRYKSRVKGTGPKTCRYIEFSGR